MSSCSQIIEPPREDTTLFGGQNSINSPPIQSDKQTKNNFSFLPMVVSASCMTLFIITMAVYVLMFRRRKVRCKKVVLVSLGMAIFFSFLATVFFFWENGIFRKSKTDGIRNENQNQSGKNVCGNSMCDPSFGETKDNCPKDCME